MWGQPPLLGLGKFSWLEWEDKAGLRLFPSVAGLDLSWSECVGDGKPALHRGEARNLQPKGGDSGAADAQGEPVPASLGLKVTWKATGGVFPQSPLIAKGIGWEEGNERVILGPSLGPLASFLLCFILGTSRASTVSYLAPRVSQEGPCPYSW